MSRRVDSGGFTLPELLLAVVILGTVIGVIGNGFITGLRVTNGADRRIAESADAQILAVWFPGDVQSAAGSVTVGTASCTATGDDPVLGLEWTDYVSATVADVRQVAYVLRPGPESSRSLWRRSCTNGTVDAEHVVARYLKDGPKTSIAAVTCPGGCSDADSVTLTITDLDGRTHRVSATRRAKA